mmetsp:Transcript_32474/g.78015  ORF Transcript_32474/g.78015 Transcript_32474/m.78015 type:complete len:501 (+) Transcript_32474:122-1624(+)
MRVFIATAFVCATAFRTKVLRRREHADDHSDASLWVPMPVPGRPTQYLNPATGETRPAPPAGALLTAAAQVRGYVDPLYADPGVQLVPNETRKSCVPHCTWNCTQPVCEQGCKPVCRAGTCETRCPKMNQTELEKCHVQCAEPVCKMFCPKGKLCSNNSTLGCPKCTTRCEEPKCEFDCSKAGSMGCKTVCPEPVCQWLCKRPKDCPKPVCSMQCEQAPDCVKDKNLVVPLPSGMDRVGRAKKARKEQSKWLVGPWSVCSTSCGYGVRTRGVKCNSGRDKDCESIFHKPYDKEACEENKGCEWTVGSWGSCSNRCGPGNKTREVECEHHKCPGDKPEATAYCEGHGETCEACEVTIYGGGLFEGWEHTFKAGSYSSSELEYEGVKCDDISSLEVVGARCQMTAFQYGDFNQQHQGWKATFREGKYDVEAMEANGARNNDISSFKLVKLPKPDPPARHHDLHPHSAPGHDSPGNPIHPSVRHSSAAAVSAVAALVVGAALL